MKNFYGFLTKKGKNIFLITLLSTALLFSSCINDLFNDDKSSKKQASQTEQTGSEELIPVKINIDNKQQIENIVGSITPQKNITPARAASPQTVTLSYKILYKKVTEASPSSTVTADNADYTRDVTDTDNQIPLTTGTWDFTLIAYYKDDSDNEKAVFSGDVLNQQISPGTSNSLSFTLQEISGNGNIKITLTIPASTEYTSVVKAQLSQIVSGTGFAPVSGYEESVLNVNLTDSTSNSYVYNQNDVQNGTFYVVFSITTTNTEAASDSSTASSATETTTYPVPVRVVTSLTSSSTETLTDIRNVCVITYDLGSDASNPVTWATEPERVFKKHQNVTLPAYESLYPLSTKIFNGWIDQDGTTVTDTLNITQNTTLSPDWITTTLYVEGSSTNTDPDALTATTAVNTLSAAVAKLVTYEALDGDSYQHEWTINVNGTCYGATWLVENKTNLNPLKITKLTITGNNNAQDILDRGTLETENDSWPVITNAGTYPLYIKNLTIQNGSNTSGGGLNISNTTAYLDNVVLIDNKASDNGGAIALTNSKLFIYGGCQIGQTSSAAVATSDSCSNRAGVSGGGIYADKDSTIYLGYTAADEANGTMTTETVTPSNIISYNYAGSTSGGTSGNSYGGGGIYCLGKLYTWGGTISYNSAGYGGGINTAYLSMKGSTVSYNTATVEGGGIYINSSSTTKSSITSAEFDGITTSTEISGNTSSSNGGGISYTDGELYISGTTICDNKATSNGGGIYVGSETSAKLFLYGETTIGATSANIYAESKSASSNSATNGGGIYIGASAAAFLNYSSEDATNHTETVNITYNYATAPNSNEGGGGIFAHTNSKLYIAKGTTINYNATNKKGGGIFGNGNTTYMSGGTIYGNDAQYGGGIYLAGTDEYKGTLYMYGEAKIGTSENLIYDSDVDIYYSNGASYGGGIYIDSLSQANLGYSGIDEENNLKPKTLTGGVCFNCAFIARVVTTGLGGGVYNKGILRMNSGNISHNTSSETSGGGVYNFSKAEFSMTGGAIESNSAVYGGGVYNKGIFHVSSGNIKSNKAAENGGGIYTASETSTDETVLEDSEITENTAVNGGGVYSISSDILYIKGATIFKDNTATDNGGAIGGENGYSIHIEDKNSEGSAYAYIEPDSICNDIYLDSSSSIFLNNNTLSPDHDYIARFTPKEYIDNVQYIYDGDDDSYKKFQVTPQTVEDTTGNTTQVEWETTSEGKIQVKQP
ncbi:MAG: hypothetical protein IJJ70_07635 [Treponema sp.]|nr:hypothetical protein [Treponema sp.]